MSARPLRVLIVAAPFVSQGGVYTSLRRTIPELQRAGFTVGVLWSSRVAGGELPGDWVRRVSASGVSAFRGPLLESRLRRAVRDFEPDVLLSVLPQSDVACSRVRRPGLPWVAMIRGRPFPTGGEAPDLKKRLWKRAVRRAYEKADFRLAISHALARETSAALGIEIDEVIHNGVDVERFPQAVGRPRRARVGFVGRLTRDKAPEVLLAIAEYLDVDVRIVGDGPLASELAARAAADPRVELTGWLSPQEAMASIDLLVVPSIREGLGNVILEAGASGVAVVARDTGGIPEILGTDPVLASTCLVPDQAVPSAFAATARELIERPELRDDMANRLRAVVLQRFTVERAADELGRVLRTVVGHAVARA